MKTKQNYERPHMRVVELRGRQRILAGSNPAPTGAKIDDYEDGGNVWNQ